MTLPEKLYNIFKTVKILPSKKKIKINPTNKQKRREQVTGLCCFKVKMSKINDEFNLYPFLFAPPPLMIPFRNQDHSFFFTLNTSVEASLTTSNRTWNSY